MSRALSLMSPIIAVMVAIVGLMVPSATIAAALVLTVGLCVVPAWLSPRGWASAPVVYVWFFAAFHAALLVMIPFGWGSGIQMWEAQDWLAADALRGAARILLVAEAGLMLGLCVTYLLGRGSQTRLYWPAPERRLTAVGDVLLTVGLVGFAVTFLQVRGWTLIGGGYEQWRVAAASAVFSASVIMLLVMFGMVLLVAGGPSRARTRGFIGFAVWAVVSLLLGNRSEVIIPMAAVLVVMARQHRIVFRWYYLVVAMAGLTAAAWVRNIRTGVGDHVYGAGPLSALAEMGATLRTVVESWRWHTVFNEPFVGLRTYWRLLTRLLPGQTPVESDPNVFNQTIMDRVGPIGGSPVAEAYHSAGMAGAFVVLMVVGIVLMSMELWPATAFSNAFVGGLLSILLMWVRNDFTPVLSQVAMLIILVGIARLLPIRDDGGARPRLEPSSTGVSVRPTSDQWRRAG